MFGEDLFLQIAHLGRSVSYTSLGIVLWSIVGYFYWGILICDLWVGIK